MRVRLMHRDRDFDADQALPAHAADLAADLGLATLWAAMAGGDQHVYDVSRAASLAGLDDTAAIAYRQDVLADCRDHPDVAKELYRIACDAMAGEKRIYGFLRRTPSGTLRRSIEVLELFVSQLRLLRRLADRHAGSFRSEGMQAFLANVADELDGGFFDAVEEHLKQLRFRGGLWMSAGLGKGNRGVGYVLRLPEAHGQGWRRRLGFGTPASHHFDVHPRDETGLQALSELTDRGTNLVANALAQSTDHVLDFFGQLRTEIAFYVGCLELEARLQAAGRPSCTPVPVAWEPGGAPTLSATGLYDGVLALRTGEPVVGNDLGADGKALVVVTGANSGGKSTFLRSVGLAQVMLQCGMQAFATSYRATVCDNVFTHFAREEDATMESGRFDEELSRMSDVADRLSARSMVLCNESFAATNEWEGSEIARQVVRALVGAGTRVLFVTHLFDLADSLYVQEDRATLFLRAERRDDGRRTFKVAEGEPLPTSFGLDLYERLGGWETPDQPSPVPGSAGGAGHRRTDGPAGVAG